MIQIPSALREDHAILIVIAGFHQVLRLFGQLRRNSEAPPVKAAQRFETRQFIQADELDVQCVRNLHFIQEMEIHNVRHAIQLQAAQSQRLEIWQREAAGDTQRGHVHPLQRAPITQAGAVVYLQIAEAVLTNPFLLFQTRQRTQCRTLVEIEPGRAPILRHGAKIRNAAAVQLHTAFRPRQSREVNAGKIAQSQFRNRCVLQPRRDPIQRIPTAWFKSKPVVVVDRFQRRVISGRAAQ